ncbi:MAG: nodulation protein NfeD [Chlamydiae bacterium]|nr:nodulation protein NfeD [Chlamydiota bacterium]MBI3277287.1 nodulation protein NfeD [Chlamydiota bacterium]
MKKLILAILFLTVLSGSLVHASDPYRIDIEGPINSVLADFVVQAMDQAQSERAPFVILRLNTPGGFDEGMRKIIGKILLSEIPVIVYVGPSGARAASAGFFILLSSDLAVMAPGTNTGAAHPLLALGGVYPLEEGKASTLVEKVTNDAKAYLKSIVEKRGRSQELAEKGITESKSFTAQEALDGKLIEFIARDENELLQFLKGKVIKRFSGEEVTLPKEIGPLKPFQMTLRQRILLAISDPNLALLLGLLGLLLLYFEFAHSGMIAPGVLGTLSILLSLIGFSLLPINFVGVLLILLAFGLFIAEIKVQGFGILGIGGIISMLIGTLILVDAPQPELKITPSVALAVVIPFGLILMLLMRLAIKTFKRKVETGLEGMVGTLGVTQTALSLEGKVLIRGEYWEAVSSRPIPQGQKVRVVKIENLKLTVEEIK